ncbi:MAG: S41 family peptidase, partial [Bacteroidota bacterium]
NSGGLNNVGRDAMSYLSSKPLTCSPAPPITTVFNQVDASLLPYLDTWEAWLKEPIGENILKPIGSGRYEVMVPMGCEEIQPQEASFDGEVILLIDGTNASAAFMFAHQFKANQLGKTVGMPTGGNHKGVNGSKYFFTSLPKTQFEVDIPLVNIRVSNLDKDQSVTPDIQVARTWTTIAEGKDVQLERALESLQR